MKRFLHIFTVILFVWAGLSAHLCLHHGEKNHHHNAACLIPHLIADKKALSTNYQPCNYVLMPRECIAILEGTASSCLYSLNIDVTYSSRAPPV